MKASFTSFGTCSDSKWPQSASAAFCCRKSLKRVIRALRLHLRAPALNQAHTVRRSRSSWFWFWLWRLGCVWRRWKENKLRHRVGGSRLMEAPAADAAPSGQRSQPAELELHAPPAGGSQQEVLGSSGKGGLATASLFSSCYFPVVVRFACRRRLAALRRSRP